MDNQSRLALGAPSFPTADEVGAPRDLLRRVGVIDIGSNSVRLVVFDGVARSPAYFFNEKVLCGLGRDLEKTGVLHPEGRISALTAIRRFVTLGAAQRLTALTAVATAAVRNASDGPEFIREIRRETGLRVRVVSGQEEATLSAQGVLLGWPDAQGFVCDIGGSSMEVARIESGRITRTETSALGPLVVSALDGEARAAHVASEVEKLVTALDGHEARLYLVGGSWRALAHLHMARTAYPLHILHEYTVPAEAMLDTARWAIGQDPAVLKSTAPSVSSKRLALIPDACRALVPLVERLSPREIAISSFGLREGLLYAHMPAAVRGLDPLLEAAEHMEAAQARFPGFGTLLYRWLQPLVADRSPARRRLIRAACLLHDISWRAHPDYRAEICFDTVARSNLAGLTHEDRVWLGLALVRRYTQGQGIEAVERVLPLLAAEDAAEAELVGRAMRLGAMVSGGTGEILEATSLRLDGEALVLTLGAEAEAQQGEAVLKRLQAVAATLDREARIEITG